MPAGHSTVRDGENGRRRTAPEGGRAADPELSFTGDGAGDGTQWWPLIGAESGELSKERAPVAPCPLWMNAPHRIDRRGKYDRNPISNRQDEF